MSYPWVPAAAQYGPRKGPVRAFIVHMAEGGGTVGFLSRPTARGVSVHYVIEYSGNIVQMVREMNASGSINPNDIRKTDDAILYGRTAAVAVMGSWADDPNSAAITVEIEGFARDGPNARETAALVTLVDDVRTRYPTMGLLGHRDFQDYKPCPGMHIPWDLLGGHGPATGGDDVARFINATAYGVTSRKIIPVKKGDHWQTLDGVDTGIFGNAGTWPVLGTVDAHTGLYAILISTGDGDLYPDGVVRPSIVQVTTSSVPVDAPPVVDCDDVVTLELERAAIRASDAVKARP